VGYFERAQVVPLVGKEMTVQVDMGTPAAEVQIDESLVRALLQTQHPELAASDITPVDSGWDNAVFRLGPKLAVRIPRRAHIVRSPLCLLNSPVGMALNRYGSSC
jgi:hypothetical protein